MRNKTIPVTLGGVRLPLTLGCWRCNGTEKSMTRRPGDPGRPRRLLADSRLWLGGLLRGAGRPTAKRHALINVGTPAMKMPRFREPGAAQAGGYVLALACLLVAVGLVFHPPPSGGFEEKPSVLAGTPWWAA